MSRLQLNARVIDDDGETVLFESEYVAPFSFQEGATGVVTRWLEFLLAGIKAYVEVNDKLPEDSKVETVMSNMTRAMQPRRRKS